MGAMQPRIFGPYEPLQRDYPIEEFLGDIAGHGVTRSIYVQTNWRPGEEVNETRWVQSVADQHGCPSAIVTYADLASDNLSATLDAHSESPAFRGVRQQLHWHKKELYRFEATPDIMNGAMWRKGFAEVAERGLVFEFSSLPHNSPMVRASPRISRRSISCSSMPACLRMYHLPGARPRLRA